MIDSQTFQQHIEEEKRIISQIYKRIEDSDKVRDQQHEAVMQMLTPVYNAFNFKSQLSKEAMLKIVQWTKVIGFILSVAALITLLWKIILLNFPK